MAFDMDKMNERARQRQQRQEARLQKEKQTRTKLLIAAAVLAVCGILIVVFSLRGPKTRGEDSLHTTMSTESVPEETTQLSSAQPYSVVRFAAAGDLNITDDVVASGGEAYDYTEAFMDVLPLLAEADLTAINLEGNVCGAPYGKDSAPQQLLSALYMAGVDLVQLANSKAINSGIAGLNATVQNVRAAGMASVGAVAEGEAPGAYVIRYVNGIKVAVVSFTKGMDGMTLPVGSEEQVNLLYSDYSSTYKTVNTKAVSKLLRKVESEKPDITIALLHWGSEYSDIHSDTQLKIRDLMLKEGVDAIIGTHPHYVQEMVYDENAGTFVAYSLGDFFGDASRSGTAYSVILELEITKDNTTGITKITDYSYTPIYTIRADTGNLRVMRLEEAINAYEEGQVGRVSEETYNEMVNSLDRIAKRTNPPKEEEE